MRRLFPMLWKNLAHFYWSAALLLCPTETKALAIPKAICTQVPSVPRVSMSHLLELNAFTFYK